MPRVLIRGPFVKEVVQVESLGEAFSLAETLCRRCDSIECVEGDGGEYDYVCRCFRVS